MFNTIDYTKIVPAETSRGEYDKTTGAMGDILEILSADSNNGRIEYYSQFQNFYVRGEGNELMLRFNQYSKELTIARVQFNNRGKGNLTKVIKALEKIPFYQKLVIESIQTEEMLNYAVNKGFTQQQYNPFNYERKIGG